jgi:hypothetical protein
MTMNNWKTRLDIAVNVAILCVCVLIAVIGVKKFLLNSAPPAASMPKTGTHLRLAGVDWSRADRTLVMALNTHCHFCSESAGFYQRLLRAASVSKVPVVAVFPQPTAEAREYWASLDLALSGVDLQQAPLGGINVSATPTLIVVDRKGLIAGAWVGKLAARGEAEVIKQIQD